MVTRALVVPDRQLTIRLLLTAVPALVGVAAWDWLQDAFGSGHEFGFHPLWIYLWHPPLMDLLFGLAVLAPFVSTRERWLGRVAVLVVASVVVHTSAVVAAVNTQWLLRPLLDIRFLSVVPIALLATAVLMAATSAVAKLTVAGRYWAYCAIAGIGSGFVFLLALELDTVGESWFWRMGLHWMVWHMSVFTAIYCGSEKRIPLSERG